MNFQIVFFFFSGSPKKNEKKKKETLSPRNIEKSTREYTE